MRGSLKELTFLRDEDIVWIYMKIYILKTAENLCYTSYKKFLKKHKLIENVTAYKDEPSQEDIINRMISLKENQLQRPLTEEEITEIKNFKNN